ncbi:MAG: hypothetical protein J3K34DRAFT_412935 [Monoraphidium minutum]|nr:MAG: hypothetical protein J3K34DRAFT_412935 [Monoraphidium minutum]
MQMILAATRAWSPSLSRCLAQADCSRQLLSTSASAAAAAGGGGAAPPSKAAAGAPPQQQRAQGAQGAPPEGLLILPMPKLSPEMQEGTLLRWLKAEGDRVEQYDVLCEVATTQLVEKAYRMGDFEGQVTLLIESQEEGVLARRLAEEGAALPVGAPIAIVSEDDSAAAVAAAAAFAPPTSDVYDAAQPRVRVLEWQSFLKAQEGGGGGGGKCMR